MFGRDTITERYYRGFQPRQSNIDLVPPIWSENGLLFQRIREPLIIKESRKNQLDQEPLDQEMSEFNGYRDVVGRVLKLQNCGRVGRVSSWLVKMGLFFPFFLFFGVPWGYRPHKSTYTNLGGLKCWGNWSRRSLNLLPFLRKEVRRWLLTSAAPCAKTWVFLLKKFGGSWYLIPAFDWFLKFYVY